MKNTLSKTKLRLKGEFPCRRLPATSCEISPEEDRMLFDVSSEPLPGSPPLSSEEKCDST